MSPRGRRSSPTTQLVEYLNYSDNWRDLNPLRPATSKNRRAHKVVNAHLRATNEDIAIQWTKAQRNRSLTNLDFLKNNLNGELGAHFIRTKSRK